MRAVVINFRMMLINLAVFACISCAVWRAESLYVEGQVFLCGEGVEGVCVTLAHPIYGNVAAVTDALGMYRFEGAWTSEYEITPFLEHAEILPLSQKIGVYDNTIVKDFVARPLWQRTYGIGGHEVVKDMAAALRCGFVYAGRSDAEGSHGAFLLRVNALGEEMWKRVYAHSLYMGANAVVALDNGGFVLAGGKESAVSGGDVWVAWTDGLGQISKEKTYHYSSWDEAFGITAMKNGAGGFVLAGTIEGGGGGKADILVLCIDGNGGKVWEQSLGGAYNEGVKRIIAARDGGYIVTGYIEYTENISADGLVLRLTSNGGQLWSKEVHVDEYTVVASAIETDDGDLIVCGNASGAMQSERGWVARLTGDGNTEKWRMEIDAAPASGINDIRLDAGGTIIGTGYVLDSLSGNTNLAVFGISPEGEMLWMHIYGMENNLDDAGMRVYVAADGGLALAGNVFQGGAGTDVMALRLTDKGELW